MTAKRVLFPANSPLAKRVKRVESLALANRPEMQTFTVRQSGAVAAGALLNTSITTIGQGTSISQRRGNKIKVWRIEVRGISDSFGDHYILQSLGGDVPVIGDFLAGSGGYIVDSSTNTRFHEWKHYRNSSDYSANMPCKFFQKFKGITVKYQSSVTPPVDNGLHVTFVNRTTGTILVDVNIRVWYTDA